MMQKKKDTRNGVTFDRLEKVSKRMKKAEPEYIEVVTRLTRLEKKLNEFAAGKGGSHAD